MGKGIAIIEADGTKRPVGRPKTPVAYTSPNISVYDINPEARAQADPVNLKTELVTLGQLRQDENTLLWGMDDAEPTRILKAIAESPTTTNCIGNIETFTRGEGFTDESLESLIINKDGDTLLDLHNAICQYYTALDGFAVNFKYNMGGRIIGAYNLPLDSCRLAAHEETRQINQIKYNPYFGTIQYQEDFTECYPIFNLENVKREKDIENYKGQAYWHSIKRTLYKHYPVPKYWSGKRWIYADAKMGVYIDKLLDNGFFESVLMKVIGDPNQMSNHPMAMKSVTGDDGVERKESFMTEGEVFEKVMAQTFSGVDKAGKVMTLWSLNKDQSVSLEAFPTNVDSTLISGTLLETIRMISISTEVPAILANLPASLSSLASGGDAIKNAVDFMQKKTAFRRQNLEKFYNTVLLPNFEGVKKGKEVKIREFKPFDIKETIDEKMWLFMNEAEKLKYIEKHEPKIEIIRPPAAEVNTAPATLDENGNTIEAPTVPKVDEVLKGLKVSEINRILSIVKKVNAGQLTPDQGKTILSGYGMNDEQISAFLNPNPVEL